MLSVNEETGRHHGRSCRSTHIGNKISKIGILDESLLQMGSAAPKRAWILLYSNEAGCTAAATFAAFDKSRVSRLPLRRLTLLLGLLEEQTAVTAAPWHESLDCRRVPLPQQC